MALLAAPGIEDLSGVVTWNAISTADRWDDATKAAWRAGQLEIVNARTKQSMPMSTRILDDYDANRERLDILAAAARVDAPMLVGHGGRDESVPLERVSGDRGARQGRVARLHRDGHAHVQRHPSARARAARAEPRGRGDGALHRRVRVAS